MVHLWILHSSFHFGFSKGFAFETMIATRWLATLLTVSRASTGFNGRDGPVLKSTQRQDVIEYEVCLSPGCVADGATATLEKLQALAPPNVIVKGGGCSSACGNGPIVIRSSTNTGSTTNKKTFRRISTDKIYGLFADNEGIAVDSRLAHGYDMVIQADQAFSSKNFQLARDLYAEAVAMAYDAAMETNAQRRAVQDSDTTGGISNGQNLVSPKGLQWMIRTRRNQALSTLKLMDAGNSRANVAGALVAAQDACALSNDACSESFQVLAEVYRCMGDTGSEITALRRVFEVSDGAKLSFEAKTERRELGFRLTKLERQQS
jgi:hypothetical protein